MHAFEPFARSLHVVVEMPGAVILRASMPASVYVAPSPWEPQLHHLEPTTECQHQMQGRSALEVVLRGHLVVRPITSSLVSLHFVAAVPGLPMTVTPNRSRRQHLHLLASKDQPLLDWWYSLFLLHSLLYA